MTFQTEPDPEYRELVVVMAVLSAAVFFLVFQMVFRSLTEDLQFFDYLSFFTGVIFLLGASALSVYFMDRF